jgi:Zn-dependent membrane protease YugP
MNNPKMYLIGIILFSITVIFSIITLPVEWDASARAKRLMVMSGIVTYQEQEDAARVLNAAFLTYVASAVTALLTLLYYLFRSGLLGGRKDD